MGFFSENGARILEKKAKNNATEIIGDYKEACKQATDEIRKEIVIEWFGRYNSDDVISSFNDMTPYSKHRSISANNIVDSVVITNNTYVDLTKYAPRPSAEAWRKRHPEKKGVESPEWVLSNLQMNQGIIGLPYWKQEIKNKKGDVVQIIEHNPIVRQPGLKTSLLYSPAWNSFISKVESKI